MGSSHHNLISSYTEVFGGVLGRSLERVIGKGLAVIFRVMIAGFGLILSSYPLSNLTVSVAAASTPTTASAGNNPSRAHGKSDVSRVRRPASKKKRKAIARQATTQVGSDMSAEPTLFVESRVSKVLRELKGRPPRPRTEVTVDASITPTRSEWLHAVYSNGLVDTSQATALISDKLLFYELVKRELGERAELYIPRTRGLKATLAMAGALDSEGRLKADGEAIESQLFKFFPAGFVVRPAVGVAPKETGHGLFADTDSFIQELMRPETYLYKKEHLRTPIRSTVLDEVASGEAVILQEDLIQSANARSPLKRRQWREVRVHTYEGRVITDATPTQWFRSYTVTPEEVSSAQNFVQDFLAQLPASVLTRQALSFDVLVLDNGERRIVDLITNRGRRVGWSTYLDQPRILGAYTRHFEKYANAHFAGVGGTLLRHNWGHYLGYWSLKIDRSRPGVERAMAWIPPWP